MIAEARQTFHVALATFDFFIEDHAVETLLALDQFIGQIEVVEVHETELMKVLGDLNLGIFNALGNFNFLLASEQGNLAHLLEIHANGVIEDVELLFTFCVIVVNVIVITATIFEAIHLGCIDDIELHRAQLLHDGLDVIRINDVVRQNLVDVIVGEIFLLFRKFDQLTDFLLNLRGVNARLFLTTFFR